MEKEIVFASALATEVENSRDRGTDAFSITWRSLFFGHFSCWIWDGCFITFMLISVDWYNFWILFLERGTLIDWSCRYCRLILRYEIIPTLLLLSHLFSLELSMLSLWPLLLLWLLSLGWNEVAGLLPSERSMFDLRSSGYCIPLRAWCRVDDVRVVRHNPKRGNRLWIIFHDVIFFWDKMSRIGKHTLLWEWELKIRWIWLHIHFLNFLILIAEYRSTLF